MSENEYWVQVRALVESRHSAGRTKREISEEIVHLVHTAHAVGEVWAAEVLTRWNAAGAAEDYGHIFKDLNTVTYIRGDGQRVRKTVGYSRPKRDKESGAIVGWQMQAWWGMSRAAVAELRQEMFAQGERLSDVVAALDQLLSAMDRHPDALTARDAWEADGRDVGEIELAMTGT